jgi:hypothetical protein
MSSCRQLSLATYQYVYGADNFNHVCVGEDSVSVDELSGVVVENFSVEGQGHVSPVTLAAAI